MERKLELAFAGGVQNAESLHTLHCDVVVRELKRLQCGIDPECLGESLGPWRSDFVDCLGAAASVMGLLAVVKGKKAESSQLRSSSFSVVFVFSASLSSLTLSSLRCTTGHSCFHEFRMCLVMMYYVGSMGKKEANGSLRAPCTVSSGSVPHPCRPRGTGPGSSSS